MTDFIKKSKRAELENKIPDVSNFATKTAPSTVENKIDYKLSSLNRKITSIKTKHLLVENELNKLKNFDSSCFIGKRHFEEDGTQNYLVFQPIYMYFKKSFITQYVEYVSERKSKGLSSESIRAISTSDNSLNPTLCYSKVIMIPK